MYKGSIIRLSVLFSIVILTINSIFGQISAPEASKIKPIDFPLNSKDTAYIFCAEDENSFPAYLIANTPMGVNSVFSWEKYDEVTATFQQFRSINQMDTLTSVISDLKDGLYRVTITGGGTTISYQKWVFNNWLKVVRTEIPDSSSNCIEYKVLADTSTSKLYYYDINSNQQHSLRNPNIKLKYRWFDGEELISSSLNFTGIPRASDSPIRLRLLVVDEFGCETEGFVDYNSKVPLADFSYNPTGGEAVLKVEFSNKSINYDSVFWFFYKDMNIIKKEAEDNENEVVDSIDFVLIDDAPIYEFEKTGEYRIKVVTLKQNTSTGNCFDTLFMKAGEFIMVDTSLVVLPNVFTPNGDGVNDVYVVESRSLKSMTIKIFNRWGGLIHNWSYSNIRSSDYTIQHSVWDGKIGGAMASPGVYYVVVRAVGRDGKERNLNGFIHLFRQRD